MTKICFVSYEIHPTVRGGCGVLLYNAAHALLSQGHELIFLLDILPESFQQFNQVDRLNLPNSHNCRAYQVEALTADLRYSQNAFHSIFEFRTYRFHIAAEKIYQIEKPEIIEFFEYCGVAYTALCTKVAGLSYSDAHLVVRLHSNMELIDRNQPPEMHSLGRYLMYGLEHHALRLAETALYPSRTFLENEYRPYYETWFGEAILSKPPLVNIPQKISTIGDPEVILFYGRLHGIKGVDLFIDAAIQYLSNPCNLPRQFYLVGYDSNAPPEGGDSYRDYLLSKVPPHLRQYFHFTGQLSWQELSALLPQVLFAVIPSYVESFSYAAHELYAAGIPLIVSNIPVFHDCFQHEDNALLFDGTTSDLTRQMERLSGDADLRHRITFPYVVTQESLGDFYTSLQRSSWITPLDAASSRPSLLVCLMCDKAESATAARQSFQAFLPETSSMVSFRLAQSDDSGRVAVRFLGRLYSFEDLQGQPLNPMEILTQEALLMLRISDSLEPRYLDVGLDTLARQPRISFVGSWRRIRKGDTFTIETFPYDAALELLPFSGTTLFSRFILRTTPGQLLIDLFDPRAARLGELAYLWKLDNGEQCGIIIPEPWITQEGNDDNVLESNAFDYLILQDENPWRKKRLTRYLLTLFHRASTLTAPLHPEPILPPATSCRNKWAGRLQASRLNRWLNRYPRLKQALMKATGISRS